MLTVMVAAGGLSYFQALRESNVTHDRWLYDSARSLARQVKADRNGVSLDLPRAALEMLEWDEFDKIYYRVSSARQGVMLGHRDLPAPPAEDASTQFFDTVYRSQPLRAVVVRLRDLPDGDSVTVEVAETLKKRRAHAESILLAVLLPQIVLILLVWALLYLGVKRGLKPLGELEEAVHARSPGDMTPLPNAEVPAEVRPLTEAINALLLRLESALDAQQRFITDAAHQLRTPLAALKVQLQRALREQDAAARETALAQVLQSTERSVHLSKQLLLLARAEPGAERALNMETLDLRQLAQEAGGPWALRAAQQGMDLGLEAGDAPALVRGDALLLGELINNLLDNALRYAGKDARITLRVAGGEGPEHAPQLIVEDNGPGIPEAERDTVFERFHRASGSPGDGSGLGLAIVREIARVHGADVGLQAPEGGGARFCVRFPAFVGALVRSACRPRSGSSSPG